MGADMYYIRGVHKERGLSIGYCCLNCASETFTVTVNGMLLNLEDYKTTELGYLFISKGKEVVVAEIKRMLRASRKEARYCTYGFREKDNPRRYSYIRGLAARDDNLSGKFMVLKEARRYFSEQEWKIQTSATAKLGADYKAESVTKEYTELDPMGLIRINFVPEYKLLVPIPKKTERKGA